MTATYHWLVWCTLLSRLLISRGFRRSDNSKHKNFRLQWSYSVAKLQPLGLTIILRLSSLIYILDFICKSDASILPGVGWWGERCRVGKESWTGNLITRKPGTQVPVQIPDGYPGTKIPESPSTNPVHVYGFSEPFTVSIFDSVSQCIVVIHSASNIPTIFFH